MSDWHLPEIDLELCTRCGACVVGCPTHAVDLQPEGPVIARPLACTFCAECEALCPVNAIRCEFEIVWEPQRS